MMTSERNCPGPGMAGVNEAFTGAPTAQLAGSELLVTCPAAPPLATVVSTKSTVPRGALATEQLGHFVRSAYVRWPAPVLVITRTVACAPHVPARADIVVAGTGGLEGTMVSF